ncbi:phosphotransferase enzyme family protein [Pseudonocardia oceani]|uniref:Phosphotransferase n=1 Tax=Pseudonocardia oceani TaxID=2792013 RepID=A0ABS6UAR7_9PSEU|nr:phosphotransferase [Pseudonocardia oceani]MBW0091107.1 phosphotransferase [Pseudonocardia oceani]MBW0110812.1 phosphotransferase [Pseudonocardia oceani]MBW0123791.1 phosphotransferase [Pseudonocardia oceani]MBW0129331.1 phosphotransferase [Pseudonocardia oceani]
MSAEIPLLGGTANRGRVHRVGDTVRRPLRPTAPAVHALLRHLEDVGFDGAPRVLGVDDQGREVLTYIPGEAVTAPAPPWGLTDAALGSVGRLLRRFHDAVADFDPAPHDWSSPASPPFSGGGIAHNDPNLDNVVFHGDRAVALIDFDLAAPGAPVWDVAGTARFWAPLRDPVDTDDGRAGRELDRLRVLVDAYGLDDDGRARLADAALGHHAWMSALVGDGARTGVPGFAEYWTPQARARSERTRAWLERRSGAITAALA